MSKLTKTIANKIYKLRDELDVEGNAEHDWYLARKYIKYLEETKNRKIFEVNHLKDWLIKQENSNGSTT